MKTNISPIESDSDMKRFKISNNFVISPKRKKSNEISIVPPEICPICGSKEIAGDFKLYPENTYKKFLSIFLCKDHYKSSYLTSKFIGGCPCFILIVILILAYFLTPLFLIFVIGGIAALIFIFYTLFKVMKFMDAINKNITLRFSSKESIISIKRADWANEFQNLNQCDEYIFDYNLTKESREKWIHSTYQMIKFVVISSSMMIIFLISSSMVQNVLLKSLLLIFLYISLFIAIGSIIFFGIKTVYYSLKEIEIKNSEKENYTKKNCVIILLIIIAVPSIIWIVGTLIEYFLLK